MSTGLSVFDTTVQESNTWLAAVEERLKPCDRQQAYAGLRAGLHALRDRLPTDGVISLSAQLPMLLRGMFLEGWRPHPAGDERSQQEFCATIAERLPPAYPREANAVAEAVFAVITDKVDPGEARKLITQLPAPLRPLWPEILWAM